MKPIFSTMLTLAIMACCVPLNAGTLETELGFKSQAIAEFLKSKDHHRVTFAPIAGLPGATGLNRIPVVLEQMLSEHGIEIVGDATIQLDIDVELAGDDATLFIDFELKDNKGRRIREWAGEFTYQYDGQTESVKAEDGLVQAKVDYADDVQKILSVPYANHELPVHPSAKKQVNKTKLKELTNSYQQPVSYLKNSYRVSSHQSGLFQMEILRTTDPAMSTSSYQPLLPHLAGGIPRVDLNKGDMVGVRLYNNSDSEVAVEICLDGINSFQFSSEKQFKHYMIPAGRSILIRGFHQSYQPQTSEHVYRHFQIVDYLDSAWFKAQQAGAATDASAMGSISAHFSKTSSPRGGTRGGLFGEGKEIREKAKVEKRIIGPVVETIVVQYDKPTA